MGTDVIFGLLTALVGFFLIRFWYLVDEIRKDIKQVLVNGATRDQQISDIKKEVDELQIDQKEIKRDVESVQKDVIKLKSKLLVD